MNDERSHRPVVIASAWSVSTLALGQGAPWIAAVSAMLCVGSILLAEAPRGHRLPRHVSIAIGTLIIVAACIRLALAYSLDNMVAMAAIVPAAVLVLRLWTVRRLGEDRASLHLCAIIIAATAFMSPMPLPALFVAIGVPILIYAKLCERLTSGSTNARMARARILGTVLPPALRTDHPSLALLWTTAVLVISSSTVALIVFISFPRSALGESVHPYAESQTGLTTVVELSATGPILESRREALEIVVKDPSGARSSALGALYVRGAVLDQYDPVTKRWFGSNGPTRFIACTANIWESLGRGAPSGAGGIWQIDFRSRGASRGVLPLIQATFALRTSEDLTLPYAESSRVVLVPPMSTWSSRVNPFPTEEDLALLRPAHPTERIEVDRDAFGPAVREMAESIKREAHPRWSLEPNEYQQASILASAIEMTIESDPYRYALRRIESPVGVDPITHFLFESREGHCELFASAMVALCRSLGIEARIISGYLATEFNTANGTYTVRESDAHAWTEVRTGVDRWTVFDAAPLSRITAAREGQRSWMDRILAAVAPVEEFIARHIISFDSSSQNELLIRIGHARDEWIAVVIAPIVRMIKDISAWLANDPMYAWQAQAWILSIGLCLFAASLALTLKRWRNDRLIERWRPDHPTRHTAGATLRLFMTFDGLHEFLHRTAGPRRAGWTLLDWASAVPREHAVARHEVSELVKLFYRARFGGVLPTTTDHIEARLRTLRRSMNEVQ